MADKIKFVTSKFSPYGHRVEMVLIEKNIPYEKVEVDFANKPDWFVKDSPLGKVPIIYVGDKVLFESIAMEVHNPPVLSIVDVTHKPEVFVAYLRA